MLAARVQDLSLNPQKLAGQCGKLKCCLNYETAAYVDASSRIPKVHNPLEFQDGLAYLMKTDILREIMYFSYDPSSLANLYPLYAEDVWDIIKMNRNGEKPESLKGDIAPAAPEFVTAVGDHKFKKVFYHFKLFVCNTFHFTHMERETVFITCKFTYTRFN